MAQKYPGGPPPPYKAQPQVYVAPTTVIVQQQKPAPGLFSSLGNTLDRELNNLGKQLDSGIAVVTAPVAMSPVLDVFHTGNVIQLVSRVSNHALQIVMSPSKQLVVDGAGGQGPQFTNAHWTIVNEGNNVVKLHNNNNFLTIVNGETLVVNFPSASHTGVEVKFQLVQMGPYVVLRSVKEPGRHVAVLRNGQLGSPRVSNTEECSHFAAKLVYSPYKK